MPALGPGIYEFAAAIRYRPAKLVDGNDRPCHDRDEYASSIETEILAGL
jgi:hypothetical protein